MNASAASTPLGCADAARTTKLVCDAHWFYCKKVVAGLSKFLADTRPLHTIAYRRLFAAQVVTVIGAQMTIVAVPQQIYDISRSTAMVGLTGVFSLVPLVVFGLWGGALADSMDRRTLLTITTGGLIGTTAMLCAQAALGNNNVWLVLGLLAVQQSFFAMNTPTRTAVFPRILPPEQLAAASSLNMTVLQAGSIVGPLLAGVLIPLVGFSVLYGLDAVFMLATLWAVIKLPPLPPTSSVAVPGIRAVVDGFAYLGTQRILLASFVVDIIAMVFGMVRVLFPQIAHENFGGDPAGGWEQGLLYAAMAMGAVVGGVFSGWVSRIRHQGRAVLGAIVVWGASVATFGAVVLVARPESSIWLFVAAVVALAVGGWADMVSAALRQTILLAAATDEMRGRLQGVFLVVVAGGPRIGDAVHGFGGSIVGPAASAMAGGAAVVGGMCAAAGLFPRFRTYQVDTGARASSVTS